MKIRNLLVMAITIALAAVCAQAQPGDGSVTFKDHLGRSITISRFGAVLSFKDSKGAENATDHAFRICPSGGNSKCIDSNAPTDGTSAELKVKFPEQGDTIGKNQTLIVTATIRQGALTVARRMTWQAGSSVINIDETISASSAISLGALEEGGKGLAVRDITLGDFDKGGKGLVVLDKPCPDPPGGTVGICPPEMVDAWKVTQRRIELTSPLVIRAGKALLARVVYHIFLKSP